jgi:peptidoglycan/LPS O-acetylase OafA/YrhL
MRPSISSRVHGLDTLRMCAIVAVMIYHLQDALPKSFSILGQYGWMGVDLFFVLSGYLIGYQLLKPYGNSARFSISLFYQRRLFRILPAYVVVLLLYMTVPAWREAPGLPPAWQFLTFTQNILFQPQNRAFSHAWSLCVEEHFYLVLPLLVIWAMRRPSARKTGVLIAAVVVFGLAARAFAITHITEKYFIHIYYQTYMRLDGLVVGVSLALIRVFRLEWWNVIARRGHATFFTGCALVASVMWMFRNNGLGRLTGSPAWGTIIGYPLLACGLGLIVASSLSSNGLLNRYKFPGAHLVATLAFSLYLTHKAIIHLDQTYLPSLTSARDLKAITIYLLTCLAAAGALHLLVERPSMLLRNLIERRSVRQVENEMQAEPAL